MLGTAEQKPVKSYRDLIVWQRSIQMIAEIYRMTKEFPREEIYGLTSQIRRAAVSVGSNIAEGHGRLSLGEYRHFLGMSRGSNYEIQTQLEVTRALDYGSNDSITRCEQLSDEVGRMLNALLTSLAPKT